MDDQSWNGETNVIVNRRIVVFVTRIKHVLVARVRDPWSPRLSDCHPFLKDEGKRIRDQTEKNGVRGS